MAEGTTKDETWIRYAAYRLRDEYRVMPEASRFQLAAFLVDVLESPDDRVDVECFASAGLQAGHDFLVRYTAPTPDELQEIAVKVRNSGLGRYLDVPHSWLAQHRACPHDPGPGEAPSGDAKPAFLVVHGVRHDAAWHSLEDATRAGLTKDFLTLARSADGVHLDLAFGYGLGGHEWVLGFETDSLEAFEVHARNLRRSVTGRHSSGTQVLVGKRVKAYEALELAGAL